MNFVCLPFNKLSSTQLYELLHLRSEIFVVEQNCIYQDLDRKDIKNGVHHLMLYKNGDLIAYARLLPPFLSYDTPSIGRILVSSLARNKGFGQLLIKEALKRTFNLWPNNKITIGAQSHLSNYYQSHGFEEISEHYLEDGIEHVDMRIDPPYSR